MDYIRLITCNDAVEANLLKGRLESKNIPSIITNETSTTVLPYLNGMLGAGVQVLVHKNDFEQARKIVNESLESVENQTIICPYCRSKEVRFGFGRNSVLKVLTVILSCLIAIPFGNIQLRYSCQNCGHSFLMKV